MTVRPSGKANNFILTLCGIAFLLVSFVGFFLLILLALSQAPSTERITLVEQSYDSDAGARDSYNEETSHIIVSYPEVPQVALDNPNLPSDEVFIEDPDLPDTWVTVVNEVPDTGPIVLGEHAVERHGAEAVQIRTCLSKDGAYQVWQARDEKNVFYLLCQMPSGNWGMQIVKRVENTLYELSSYIKGDGSWHTLTRYLGRVATKFTGRLIN